MHLSAGLTLRTNAGHLHRVRVGVDVPLGGVATPTAVEVE